jgi:SAM-dependent methyltransferase
MTDCIICSGPTKKVLDATPAPFIALRLELDPKTPYILHECLWCEHQFFTPRLTQEQESKLYLGYRNPVYNAQRLAVEPQYGQYIESFEDRDSPHHRERIVAMRWVTENMPSPKTVLDFGGEADAWLARGVYPNADITAYDPSERTSLSVQKYDLVICAHVLEHVADPVRTLRQAVSRVKPGGHLYLEVPEQRLGMTMHEHVSGFSYVSFRMLAAQAPLLGERGFKQLDYSWPGKPSLGMWAKEWNL